MSSACEVDICGVVGMHALAARVGNAERAARLEQQLRRRSRQGRLLPLQQSAEAFLQERAHGFPGDHRGNGGQGEHLRHLRRAGEGRRDELRALFHQRPAGHIRGYVGEGEFTDDPLETFGGAGVVQIPQAAEAAALHLRARLRASRGGQPLHRCRGGARSGHALLSAGACYWQRSRRAE